MGYTVVPIEKEEHRAGIVSMWENNFPTTFADRFKWLYEDNPFGPTRAFIAKHDKTGEIVGSASVYSHCMKIDNESIPFGVACDFIVDPNHRVFGPALKLERAVGSLVGQPGLDFIFAFPNKDSLAIFLRVGYRSIGKARNYVKLLKTGPKLRKILKIGLISTIAGFLLDGILLSSDIFRLILKPRDLGFETGTKFNRRFDTLWENAQSKYPLSGSKKSEYLNWRYAKCENQDYRNLRLVRKSTGEIKSYVIYYVENNIAFISDVFSDDEEGNIHFLLLGLSKYLRRQKVESISLTYMGKETTDNVIKKLFFFKRECDRDCMILLNRNIDYGFKDTLFDEKNWFIFEGEMDL